MKPIKLAFSGLHSYREEQLVDFSELGYAGIFGVFGPTGGGKSTILDAVTLALFGRVERAKNGTRGIMNQFENRLTVSFEFGLGSENFQVERVYQRDKNDPDSVKVKNARLIKISGTNTVLADKANEVDSSIAGLLGMSFEDFSRAVILPQGKFDQFLKLTGGDRARMLETILRLERYGEVLWKRASRLEASLVQELTTNQMLIEQLGDASEEAVSDAGQKLNLHRVWLAEKEKELQAAENHHSELLRLTEICDEIKNLKQKKALIESQQEVFAQARERLAKALAAEPLRGQAEQLAVQGVCESEEAQMAAAGEAALGAAEVNLKAADQQLAMVKAEMPMLKEIRENALPKAALAINCQNRWEEIDAEIRQLENTLKNKRKELQELVIQGQEKGKILDQWLNEKESLVLRRLAMEGLFKCRGRIDLAIAAQADLDHTKAQAQEAAINKLRIEKRLLEETQNLRQLLIKNIHGLEPDENQAALAALVQKAADAVAEATDKYTQAEGAKEKAMVRNMAAALSEKLALSEPCPVCGSIEHPSPADLPPENESIAAARLNEAAAKAELERLRQWEREISEAYNTVRNLQQEFETQYIPLEKSKSLAVDGAVNFLQEAVRELDASLLAAGLAGMISTALPLHKLKEVLDEADSGHRTMTARINELELTLGSLQTTVVTLRENYSGLKAEITGQESVAVQKNIEVVQLKAQIGEITGGLPPGTFAQGLKERIAAIESANERAQQDWAKASEEHRVVAQKKAVLAAGLAKTREHLAALRDDFAKRLAEAGFVDEQEMRAALLEPETRQEIITGLEENQKELARISGSLQELQQKAPENNISPEELARTKESLENLKMKMREGILEEGALTNRLAELKDKQGQWQALRAERSRLVKRKELASKLVVLVKGRRFVQFLAEEHLQDMAREASARLGQLTAYRYGLELDSGFNFVLRDDFSGGQRRPVNSLSGGEIFLTSLALALALSSKIQLRGQYPLGFFFLDEGFGTLDPEKLEVVMQTLERLHDGARIVGVITHVPELRHRLPRYLEIIPAKQDGIGSRVILRRN